MPVYTYSAIEPGSAKSIAGKLEAQNLREAKDLIRQQGQIPTRLEEDSSSTSVESMLPQVPLFKGLSNPSLKDITIFTQQLFTLLDAGIPLVESLFLLEQQTNNEVLQEALKNIRADVIAGDSFSGALSRHTGLFNPLYINMVRAGESSGSLDRICERLSILLDKEMVARAKVRGAMMVPVVSAAVIFLVTMGLLVFIVPQFATMFNNAGRALPLPTQLLLFASDFLIHYWWALFLALGAGVYSFNSFRLSESGKPLVDEWLLKLPVMGDLLNKSYSSTFIRTLGTLQASGVSLTEAIGTASTTVGNTLIQKALGRARESILMGGNLAKPLEQSQIFPFIVVKMVAIGEETGNLENMLFKASVFLDRDVDEAIDNMTKLIQPVMTVILGGILLFILLGLYLPIFDLHKLVGG